MVNISAKTDFLQLTKFNTSDGKVTFDEVLNASMDINVQLIDDGVSGLNDKINNEIEELSSVISEDINALDSKTTKLFGDVDSKLQRFEDSEVGFVSVDRLKTSIDEIQYTIPMSESKISLKEALDALFGGVKLVCKISSNKALIRELGERLSGVVISWSYSDKITSQTLNNEVIPVDKRSYDVLGDISNNTTFKIQATDGVDETVASLQFTFLRGCYCKARTIGTYDSGFISSMDKTLSSSKKLTFIANASVDEYIYVASPVAYGECSFVVNSFVGGFEKVSTIDYTNQFGYTEPYYLYKSTHPNLGVTSVSVM